MKERDGSREWVGWVHVGRTAVRTSEGLGWLGSLLGKETADGGGGKILYM